MNRPLLIEFPGVLADEDFFVEHLAQGTDEKPNETSRGDRRTLIRPLTGYADQYPDISTVMTKA